MITATRRVQFCAGHRVHRHESKCRNLHGHNYVAFFTAEAERLDENQPEGLSIAAAIDLYLAHKLRHVEHGIIKPNKTRFRHRRRLMSSKQGSVAQTPTTNVNRKWSNAIL